MIVDIQKLRALAEAARKHGSRVAGDERNGFIATENARSDRNGFIAATSPDAVLELLDEIDRLRANLDTHIELEVKRVTFINSLTNRLSAMTAARDQACRLLEGCIGELADHESDPAMMDGHRDLLAAVLKVGAL